MDSLKGNESLSSNGTRFNQFKENESLAKGDSHKHLSEILTTSQWELLVMLKKKYKNRLDSNSDPTLESNLILLRATIEDIIDKCNNNLRDIERQKKRYNEIIGNRSDSVDEMEEFKKDMLKYIISTESINKHFRNETSFLYPINESMIMDKCRLERRMRVAAYEMAHTSRTTFTIDEVPEESDSFYEKGNSNTVTNSGASCNIYLLPKMHYEQSTLGDKKLSSEIHVTYKRHGGKKLKKESASAENFMKIAEKRRQVEKYVSQELRPKDVNREIPIKVSYAKNNIHRKESIENDKSEGSTSIMYKICSYLCRRVRRS